MLGSRRCARLISNYGQNFWRRRAGFSNQRQTLALEARRGSHVVTEMNENPYSIKEKEPFSVSPRKVLSTRTAINENRNHILYHDPEKSEWPYTDNGIVLNPTLDYSGHRLHSMRERADSGTRSVMITEHPRKKTNHDIYNTKESSKSIDTWLDWISGLDRRLFFDPWVGWLNWPKIFFYLQPPAGVKIWAVFRLTAVWSISLFTRPPAQFLKKPSVSTSPLHNDCWLPRLLNSMMD